MSLWYLTVLYSYWYTLSVIEDSIANDKATKEDEHQSNAGTDHSIQDNLFTPSNIATTSQDQCSPKSVHDTSNLSTCSDWFNTTREEMILYEKYGENYDVIVEKMSKQEKLELKEEVSNATPKNAEELLEKNDSVFEFRDDNDLAHSKDTLQVYILILETNNNNRRRLL